MNTNLIHKWMRDARFAPDEYEAEPVGFLPVEIESAVAPAASPDVVVSHPAPGAPVSAQRVDITLSDGRRILVEGTTALSAVLALVEGLMP
jgi:transposase